VINDATEWLPWASVLGGAALLARIVLMVVRGGERAAP
jgi:hypothetical protein